MLLDGTARDRLRSFSLRPPAFGPSETPRPCTHVVTPSQERVLDQSRMLRRVRPIVDRPPVCHSPNQGLRPSSNVQQTAKRPSVSAGATHAARLHLAPFSQEDSR